MGRLEKNLFSIDYPEVKGDMCVTGWTWSLCPTMQNPGRKCKQEIKTPCFKRRTSNYRLYVYLDYPDSADAVVRHMINRCHLMASGAAINVIHAAVVGSTAGSPAAQIAAAAGAIPVALSTYGQTFWKCLTNFTISQTIKDNIKYDITSETKTVSPWRIDEFGFNVNPYDVIAYDVNRYDVNHYQINPYDVNPYYDNPYYYLM